MTQCEPGRTVRKNVEKQSCANLVRFEPTDILQQTIMWIHPSQHGRVWLSIAEDGAKPKEAKDGVAKLAKGDSWRDWRNIRTEHVKSFVLFVELEQSSDVSP